MYYILESDKHNLLFKLFNIIRIREDKIILPVTNNIIKIRKAERLAQKTYDLLMKTNCNSVVLSKKIKTQETYRNYLYSKNINIIEADILNEIMLLDLLQYIIDKKKLKAENTNLTIFINEITSIMYENIKVIIEKYKKVNIITNHIERFKKIEDKIFETQGISLCVGNNKKKGALKSNIIINVDFPNELINKYVLADDAIIFNLRGNVKIERKRFTGININNYEIKFDYFEEFDYEKERLFDKKDLYEAEFAKNKPFEMLRRDIKKYNVKVVKLYGANNIL